MDPLNNSNKERKMCRGWKSSRSGDIYNKVYRGFDVKNLTPYDEIYKFLLKIWEKKKNKKNKEHPDNTTQATKRVQLRGNIDYKNTRTIKNKSKNLQRSN